MKRILFLLIVVFLLAATAAVVVKQQVFGASGTGEWTTFQVPSGATAKKAGRLLQKKELVSSGRLFAVFCRIRRIELKAGWYDIPPRASIAEIADILANGKEATRKVTIPEGRASWEMPAYFKRALPDFDSTKWDAAVHDSALLKELDVGASDLEGYLLPETYPIAFGTSEKDIAKRMVRANFDLRSKLKAKESPIYRELGGWNRVLTLASVVEEETGKTDERALIAGVFLNRLREGTPLGADPTVRFIFKNLTGPIYKSQLQSDSPYNTRQFKGLPPGPISNPGKKAIEAVLHPQPTDALFFVAKDDGSGTHFFAKSLSEHNRFKATAAKNRGE